MKKKRERAWQLAARMKIKSAKSRTPRQPRESGGEDKKELNVVGRDRREAAGKGAKSWQRRSKVAAGAAGGRGRLENK